VLQKVVGILDELNLAPADRSPVIAPRTQTDRRRKDCEDRAVFGQELVHGAGSAAVVLIAEFSAIHRWMSGMNSRVRELENEQPPHI
jgi:hypothetical protein